MVTYPLNVILTFGQWLKGAKQQKRVTQCYNTSYGHQRSI